MTKNACTFSIVATLIMNVSLEDKNEVATKLLEFGKSGKQLITSINGWPVQ